MKNIIKKNQLAILVIALMLITAGYLNYTSNNENESIYTSSIVNTQTQESHIGDATLVSSSQVRENDITSENIKVKNVIDEIQENNIIESDDLINQKENVLIETNAKVNEKNNEYFITSKLQRDTMYSQMIEIYQKILESNTISETQKTIAAQEIANINLQKNAIMISENLIKTKGFEECIIFVNDTSISIIVKSEELKEEQIAQIQNIVAREMNAQIENIHISNK